MALFDWVGTKPGGGPASPFVNDVDTVPVNDDNLNAMVDTTQEIMDTLNTQTPLNNGLVCAPVASVPEWPDNAAGTTYFQNAWVDDDSWAKSNITSTFLISGIAKLTCTGTLPTYTRTISIPTATVKTVKIKLRKLSGPVPDTEISLRSLDSVIMYANGTYTSGTGWQILNFDVQSDADWTGTLTTLRILFRYADATSVWEIDWIYIGDGTYSSLALDGSGSGNHATVYGATPVDTVAGRGFSFDGVNDSLLIGTLSVTQFSFSGWLYKTASGTTRTFLDIGNILLTVGATEKIVVNKESVAGVTTALTLASGQFVHVVIDVNSINTKVYVNGILTDTLAAVTGWTAGVSYLGQFSSGQYFLGTLADPRIYNRALTAEEVWELYSKPGMALMSGPVIASVSGTPHSLVARDANGLHNTIKLAAGAGIDFSANASAAGMTSEVLSDYEEGTWTPGISFGGAAVGITYTTQLGAYTKIGNRVFVSCTVVLSAKGSSAGDALLTGLPFTSANSLANASPMVIGGINTISFADYPHLSISGNTTTANFYETTNAGVRTTLDASNFADTSTINISGSYYV